MSGSIIRSYVNKRQGAPSTFCLEGTWAYMNRRFPHALVPVLILQTDLLAIAHPYCTAKLCYRPQSREDIHKVGLAAVPLHASPFSHPIALHDGWEPGTGRHPHNLIWTLETAVNNPSKRAPRLTYLPFHRFASSVQAPYCELTKSQDIQYGGASSEYRHQGH